MRQLANRLVEEGLPIFVPKCPRTKSEVEMLLRVYEGAKKRTEGTSKVFLCRVLNEEVRHTRDKNLLAVVKHTFELPFKGDVLEPFVYKSELLRETLEHWAHVVYVPQGLATNRGDIVERFRSGQLGAQWHNQFRWNLLDIMEQKVREHYKDRLSEIELKQAVPQCWGMNHSGVDFRAVAKHLQQMLVADYAVRSGFLGVGTKIVGPGGGVELPNSDSAQKLVDKIDNILADDIVITAAKDSLGLPIKAPRRDTYTVSCYCRNCGKTHDLVLPKGLEVRKVNQKCSYCGCPRT